MQRIRSRKIVSSAFISCIFVTSSVFGDGPKFSVGSGFFINKNGDVLTNRHVVEQCDDKLLLFIDHKKQVHQATVIAVSEEYDLAALKTGATTEEFGSLATADETLHPVIINKSGWELFSFGYPNGQKTQERTVGLSIGTSNYNDPPFIGFVTLNATNGSSGSAIMDRSALLLGIVTARVGQDTYKNGENINDSQVIAYHNLNAIVSFANRHNLQINHYPRKEFHDPGFVMLHASRITGQIFCWSM
jgi:S1-C subfamily serine protease